MLHGRLRYPSVSEPHAVAEQAEEIVPGVWTWSVHDDRIDFVSTAHAVAGADGVVLIDPLPLEADALGALGDVTAICMTAGTHQRSAWRYRRELGAPVYAPALSRQIEEEPDVRYAEGDELPGGLRAVFTPGAGTTQHTFLLEREGGVAFVADLFTHVPERGLRMVRDEYMHDPAEARQSARKLLELPFSVLCLDHGAPLKDDPKSSIRALIDPPS
jgi:glyoxylase-like metal-dependent hydrolase (beta-lactamase superfamily II)